MQGDDFLYFLRSNNQYYYVDAAGNVLQTTVATPLQFTPDGWQEISIWTERNKRYFGLERSFTIPLGFVEDGKKILKYLYYTEGIEAGVSLIIQEQKLTVASSTFDFHYDHLYEGEIDFSTINDTGVKVTSNIIEGGIAKLIKANESTTYEIDFTNGISVKMDGLQLRSTAIFNLSKEDHVVNPQGYFPMAFVNQEGYLKNLEFQRTFISWTSAAPQLPWLGTEDWDSKWFVKATGTVPITITADFVLTTKAGTYFRAELVKFKESSTVGPVEYTILDQQDFTSYSDVTAVNFTHTVTLTAGEYLSLIYRRLGSGGNPNERIYFTSGELKVISLEKFKTTYVKAIKAIDLFKALVTKITDGAYDAASTLLDMRTDLVLTSGDALRGFEGAVIKTSLSQFFQSLNAILNMGMGVLNNKLVIEEKAFWFEAASVIDLGEVNQLKIYSAVDLIYNTIKIGYPNQDYDNVNGKDEPNTSHLYTTPITRVVKELNLVSEYRGDMYGIEFTRINLEGKKTTDSKSDNDTFIMQVNKVPVQEFEIIPGIVPIPIPLPLYYSLDRTLNAGATGLIDAASAFNLGISPKHNFGNHEWFFHSFLQVMESKEIVFQTTDKNAELVTDITEKDNVLIRNLAAPKFLPFLFEFETIVPDNLQDLLNANPIRKYQFSYSGMVLYGIAMRVGIEPSSRKSQVYQLLATADSDIIQLINFNG